MDETALASGHAYVQSSDSSSRPGPLPADAGRRETFRHRSAIHAGLIDMPDTAQLESEILAAVTAAGDEAALETVRVAALGKNGSVTALLKTLGTLAPGERKTAGPPING